jgi:Fur family ferric uptake transcriptional regulator
LKAEAAVGKMRSRGYKPPPQRLAILRVLTTEQQQSTGELRRRCSQVEMVTVYRTLELLSKLGIVRRMDLGDGPLYELAEDHHLICQSCGDISEFEECPLDSERMFMASTQFEVRSTVLRSMANARLAHNQRDIGHET